MEIELMTELVQRTKEATENGKSLYAIAKDSGQSWATIKNILSEKQKNLMLDSYIEIAKAVGYEVKLIKKEEAQD